MACKALTIQGFLCKNKHLLNSKYCYKHDTIYKLYDFEEIFDITENSVNWCGLLKKLWLLISTNFTLIELKSLLLSCKTLFKILSKDWFIHNTRYVICAKMVHGYIRVIEADEEIDMYKCSDFLTPHIYKSGNFDCCGFVMPSISSANPFNPIHIINNVRKRTQFYYSIKNKNIIYIESNKESLDDNIKKFMAKFYITKQIKLQRPIHNLYFRFNKILEQKYKLYMMDLFLKECKIQNIIMNIFLKDVDRTLILSFR